MAVNTTKIPAPNLSIEIFECDAGPSGTRFNWRITEAGRSVEVGSNLYTSKTRANTQAKVQLNRLLAERFQRSIQPADRITESDNEESEVASKRKRGGFIRSIKRSDGVRFQAYTQQHGKKAYVGTYKSEDDAWTGIAKYRTDSQAPSGAPIRLRVTAVYANGAERELREFAVTDDGLSGFETDDSEYIAFVTRVDRVSTPVDDVINAHVEGAPF